jgi:hypothetical protein
VPKNITFLGQMGHFLTGIRGSKPRISTLLKAEAAAEERKRKLRELRKLRKSENAKSAK